MQTGEIKEFTRAGGGAPLGSKQDLIRAVFNDDVIASGKIAGPVALADDHVVIFKVLEHHAPAPLPLANVRDQVIAAIRKSESSLAAKAAADDAVKRLQAGATFDDVVKSLGVSAAPAAYIGRSDPQLPAQVRLATFAAARPEGKAVYSSVILDNGGAALLAITAIKPGTAGTNPQNDAQLIGQYMRRDREGDMQAYVQELRRRATVKTNPAVFQ
jgi:peptidyl-prolyl cis-trans isomerase D